jgi:hypothetical protein
MCNSRLIIGQQNAQHKITVQQFLRTLAQTTFNPLTPELYPSAQRCLPRFFTADFAS